MAAPIALDPMEHVNATANDLKSWFLLGGFSLGEASELLYPNDVEMDASLPIVVNTWLGPLLTGLSTMLLLWMISTLVQARQRRKDFAKFIVANKCARTRLELPRKFMANMRNKYSLLTYRAGDFFDDRSASKYCRYGETHALYDSAGFAKVVHTIDPINVHAFLATHSQDYHGPKSRKAILDPMAQRSVLVSEGPDWEHHRKLALRGIAKGAKETDHIEAEVDILFQNIDASQKAKGEVDLLEVFYQFALNLSTKHLFGVAAETRPSDGAGERQRTLPQDSTGQPRSQEPRLSISEAYKIIGTYVSQRSKLGTLHWMADSPRYREACGTLTGLAHRATLEAMGRLDEAEQRNGDTSRFTFVKRLVNEYSDIVEIREAAMDVFLAAQRTSGAVLSWTFAELQRRPDIYETVRKEVLEKFGTEASPKAPLTWENLRSCNTLQWCLLEAMRKYPVFAHLSRTAIRDTVLPRGGGPDGSEPIAVPKGTPVTCCVYLMHRRERE